MYKEFKTYVSDNQLFDQTDRLLVAVSGGIDSMVLLDLLVKHQQYIEVAHVNYQLRGAESDQDMELVQAYCNKHNIICHTKLIDLAAALASNPDNLQAKARDVRYSFFNEIMKARSIKYIAIAHHSDDRIENYFLSSLRGTGMNGLTSMRAKEQSVIRPLLFANQADIKLYADIHDVPFREDASNKDSKYNRNYMRNDILPLIEHKIPDYRKRVLTTLSNIDADAALLKSLIANKKKELLTNHTNYKQLAIVNNPNAENMYFHILRDYRLNSDQVTDLLNAKTGTIIEINNQQFLKDRQAILIRDLTVAKIEDSVKLDKSECPKTILNYEFDISQNTESTHPINTLRIDADHIKWPLTIRKWESGDRFTPFGMKGMSKSVNKFLKDKKINQFEKEAIHVLISNNIVCAVLDIEISEEFKITADTVEILTIRSI